MSSIMKKGTILGTIVGAALTDCRALLASMVAKDCGAIP